MIKLIAITALLLSGCAATETSYALGQGIASYDELARQTGACKAKGGTIRPGGEGDPYDLSNYLCVIPRGS